MNQDKKVRKIITYVSIFSIVILVLLVLGVYYWNYYNQYVQLKGRIHGEEIAYTVASNGEIIAWLAEENGEVKQGSPVLKINSIITEEQLKALEAEYIKAKKDYEAIEHNIQNQVQASAVVNTQVVNNYNPELDNKINIAVARLKQMENLVKTGAVSQKEYAKARENLTNLENSRGVKVINKQEVSPNLPGKEQILTLSQLQIRYQELKRALEQVKKKENIVEILAPVEGKLVNLNFSPGEKFAYGDKLFTIDTGKNLALYINIQGDLINKVHSGEYVMYNIKGRKLDGMIESLSKLNDNTVVAKINLPKDVLDDITGQEEVDVIIAISE